MGIEKPLLVKVTDPDDASNSFSFRMKTTSAKHIIRKTRLGERELNKESPEAVTASGD